MDENVFLLHSFLLGVGITFLYDTLRFQMRDTGDGVVLKGIPRILACAVFCDEITGS